MQVGAGVGVGVVAAVMPLGHSALSGYRLAFLTAGAFSLRGVLITSLGLRAPAPTAEPVSAPADS
ncbi:hypothetical protein [Actinoallomurus sp. NPDC052274]|uniref:hypothetical protein n=1 Tax=Actinoallomurus sp. NPDC052274 TaxID=3155420 RepID=UPI0034452C12